MINLKTYQDGTFSPASIEMLAAGNLAAAAQQVDISSIDLGVDFPPPDPSPIVPGTTDNPDGDAITVDTQSIRFNDQPYIPVAGEFHYSRYPRAEWRDELLKMKAGGLDTAASYVFWIHHEEERGVFEWQGNKSLRDFMLHCQEVGLKAIVRIGPWCHGEVRNGGFPDWVQQSQTGLRSDNPAFLALVKPLYEQIGGQLKGLLWKDGGPVIAIQLDNECGHTRYLLALKKMARECGINVPIYTMTGWNGVPIPEQGLLPVFGAYPDGFWGGSPEEYRKFFVFSPIRDNGDMGAQMQNTRPGRNQHMTQSFPFACAEIGGGMMSSYRKRITIVPDEIAAMAMIKLGCGNNMPGYYMYHGGINPDGKFSTLQEDRPNPMPVKDYDFQTAIGAAGQIRPQYHLLRAQHTFLKNFGHELARMSAFFPEKQPASLSDFDTVRWSVRADSAGKGFLFFNNRQPVVALAEKKDKQFELKREKETVRIPRQPVDLPSGTYGFWPVNLDCDGIHLDYATVQPLSRIVDSEGNSVYFFVAIDGIRPEFAVNGKKPAVVTPGLNPVVSEKTAKGKTVALVVLTSEQGKAFYQMQIAGQDRAVLSTSTVLADSGKLRLISSCAGDASLAIFPAVTLHHNEAELNPRKDGIFSRVSIPVERKALPVITAVLKKPAGASAATFRGTDEKVWLDAAEYELQIPSAAAGRRLRLDIAYWGDAMRLHDNDKLLFDNFSNGEPYSIPLWRIPKKHYSQLTLKMLPYSNAFGQRLTEAARKDAESAAAHGLLDGVTITVVEELEIELKLMGNSFRRQSGT